MKSSFDHTFEQVTANERCSGTRSHSFHDLSCIVSLSRPVDVGSMFDTQNIDRPRVVIDLVDDAVRPAPSRPESGEFSLKRMSNLLRVLAQRPEQELDDCSSNAFWESSELSFSGRCDSQSPGLVGHSLTLENAGAPDQIDTEDPIFRIFHWGIR